MQTKNQEIQSGEIDRYSQEIESQSEDNEGQSEDFESQSEDIESDSIDIESDSIDIESDSIDIESDSQQIESEEAQKKEIESEEIETEDFYFNFEEQKVFKDNFPSSALELNLKMNREQKKDPKQKRQYQSAPEKTIRSLGQVSKKRKNEILNQSKNSEKRDLQPNDIYENMTFKCLKKLNLQQFQFEIKWFENSKTSKRRNMDGLIYKKIETSSNEQEQQQQNFIDEAEINSLIQYFMQLSGDIEFSEIIQSKKKNSEAQSNTQQQELDDQSEHQSDESDEEEEEESQEEEEQSQQEDDDSDNEYIEDEADEAEKNDSNKPQSQKIRQLQSYSPNFLLQKTQQSKPKYSIEDDVNISKQQYLDSLQRWNKYALDPEKYKKKEEEEEQFLLDQQQKNKAKQTQQQKPSYQASQYQFQKYQSPQSKLSESNSKADISANKNSDELIIPKSQLNTNQNTEEIITTTTDNLVQKQDQSVQSQFNSVGSPPHNTSTSNSTKAIWSRIILEVSNRKFLTKLRDLMIQKFGFTYSQKTRAIFQEKAKIKENINKIKKYIAKHIITNEQIKNSPSDTIVIYLIYIKSDFPKLEEIQNIVALIKDQQNQGNLSKNLGIDQGSVQQTIQQQQNDVSVKQEQSSNYLATLKNNDQQQFQIKKKEQISQNSAYLISKYIFQVGEKSLEFRFIYLEMKISENLQGELFEALLNENKNLDTTRKQIKGLNEEKEQLRQQLQQKEAEMQQKDIAMQQEKAEMHQKEVEMMQASNIIFQLFSNLNDQNKIISEISNKNVLLILKGLCQQNGAQNLLVLIDNKLTEMQ